MQIEFKPSIKDLADAFCDLDSSQMGEFFGHCANNSESWYMGKDGVYSMALYLRDEIPVGSDAARFLMDLAGAHYWHTLQYMEK